jgi:hypothetical protein
VLTAKEALFDLGRHDGLEHEPGKSGTILSHFLLLLASHSSAAGEMYSMAPDGCLEAIPAVSDCSFEA